MNYLLVVQVFVRIPGVSTENSQWKYQAAPGQLSVEINNNFVGIYKRYIPEMAGTRGYINGIYVRSILDAFKCP